jgi:low affinity Fe/Cu permease
VNVDADLPSARGMPASAGVAEPLPHHGRQNDGRDPAGRETWRDRFNRLADRATHALGSATAVVLSVLIVVLWALAGPLFDFSDSWQLVINTATTVITFWMVFVIQNSQNRDARAIHLKLDEIIRATEKARNEFIVAEKGTEEELEAHEAELQHLVQRVSAVHGLDGAPGGDATRPAESTDELSETDQLR